MSRSSRTRVALGGVAVLVAALVAPWGVGAQEGVDASVLEVGWWSSRLTAVAQPEQGFEIAAGPQGDAQSIAAIRLSVAATQVDSLQVHLTEASGGSIGSEFGTIRVCTTTDPWSAANPGAFEEAPTPDCTTTATLTRTLEGAWLGDITALVPNGGEVSLMLVPFYQPPVPVGPGMIVPIGSGDFTATGTSTAPTTGSTETTDTTSGGGFDPIDGGFGGSFGGSFGVPEISGDTDFGTTTTAAPATSGTTVPEDDFALDPITSGGEDSAPWIRLVLLVPLCAGFGMGLVRARRLLVDRGLLPAA
ncbi:MAG: hypothetical protein ACOYXM_15540 [Actinomycetota bacterium]